MAEPRGPKHTTLVGASARFRSACMDGEPHGRDREPDPDDDWQDCEHCGIRTTWECNTGLCRARICQACLPCHLLFVHDIPDMDEELLEPVGCSAAATLFRAPDPAGAQPAGMSPPGGASPWARPAASIPRSPAGPPPSSAGPAATIPGSQRRALQPPLPPPRGSRSSLPCRRFGREHRRGNRERGLGRTFVQAKLQPLAWRP